eukprot:3878623-Pyramimonas_sp.AAC.1
MKGEKPHMLEMYVFLQKIIDFGLVGPSWDASWAPPGAQWRHLGTSWGRLGRSWALLERSWAVLGASWAVLGRLGR